MNRKSELFSRIDARAHAIRHIYDVTWQFVRPIVSMIHIIMHTHMDDLFNDNVPKIYYGSFLSCGAWLCCNIQVALLQVCWERLDNVYPC